MSKNEFAITRELFISYLNYTSPVSYEQWLETADDSKAAVLFVQFYDQITLAWFKLKSIYSTEADGVAEVLQYLQKNVPYIVSDSNRFTPSYIYKISYNCLYCLCRDPNRYKAAYENETTSIVAGPDGEELDLLDLVAAKDRPIESDVSDVLREEIWRIIDEEVRRRESEKVGSGKAFAIVVSDIVGDNLDFTGKYHPFDFEDSKNPEYKNYKKSEEISLENLEKKKASIIAKYGDTLVSDILVTSFERGGKIKIKLEYLVSEKKPHKGIQEFTNTDRKIVTDDVRNEILNTLRTLLQPYKNIFAIAS